MNSTTRRKRACGNYTGRNARGKITIPEHTHPCIRRLVQEMNRQQVTIEEVARFSNVGVDTVRFWMTRHMPRLDLLDAAANAVGYEVYLRPVREVSSATEA